MFIEIDQAGQVTNAFGENDAGRIELTPGEADMIRSSKYGHAQFQYLNGSLSENADATATIELTTKRAKATLTPLEFWKAVDAMGLYDAIEAIRTDPATPRITVLEIEKASEFKRMWPTLIQLAGQLGVTDAQLDQVFGIV